MKPLNRQASFSNTGRGGVAIAIAGLFLLAALGVASLTIGARSIPFGTVLDSLAGGDTGPDGTIVVYARLPRTLAGLVAGAALGLSGALIQTICRNPLSDPGILGVNAGAGLAVALATLQFGTMVPAMQFAAGAAGALLAVLMVFAVGRAGGGGSDAGHFILAGMALGAIMGGLASGLSLLNPALFDRMRFWAAGTLDIGDLGLVLALLPVQVVCALAALLLARQFNVLALGNDIAASLGTRTIMVQSAGLVLAAVLCGTATALTGPIGFVGLMAPHVARRLVGPDMRRVLPFCLIFAPALLLAADILGRVVAAGELRVSIVTAFLGAPMLIWMARRTGRPA